MWQSIAGAIRRAIAVDGYNMRRQLDPEQLGSFLRPIYKSLVQEIGYTAAVPVPAETIAQLHQAMKEKADQVKVDYMDDRVSAKAFFLGLSLACSCCYGLRIDVQVYVGIYTWLVILIEDKIGECAAEVEGFERRFLTGEEQPTPLLRATAALMKETWDFWDPILANLIVTSTMDFVTSNIIDTRREFKNMPVTKAGKSFPYFFRNMSGISIAYACFIYSKEEYPDIGLFLEALPDMAFYIANINDVLSFYKEEIGGETHNYIHNRARCEQQNPLVILKKVKAETAASVERVRAILEGRTKYFEAWERQLMGMITMHTVNPRYRLADLGLGEAHPVQIPVSAVDSKD
ncbi:hypothetical protein M406DRAFT_36360 [Cryphonectria parasitica EP155]|uniref:Terpene synthase n=1 Tax=Cryphonectria parasitica (strain ATCC 38755 / EP155) TaxID=660469 RepID=A0A9P4Y9V8_CRYP1|nr:uncharacterized protein M406DRAFT_36360 [Cryphonectria parasitica EP155]KAF3769498.1 hypothetical protein M406DRAFT_36360 [Cryphonectria parasitica EP155]